ncbi:MAG: hypothetical protein FJ398_00080 [Verrucomicrobia bacterium]|nr:hypothetical protein [Verrucomicrobiota bacterium]
MIWLLNGMELARSLEFEPQPDLGWQLTGTGVFNLLGNTDLLWRHRNGRNLVWLMEGNLFSKPHSRMLPLWQFARCIKCAPPN